MTQWTFPPNPPSLSGGSRNETSSVAVAQKSKWREKLEFLPFFLCCKKNFGSFFLYEGPFGNLTPGSQLDRGFAAKITHFFMLVKFGGYPSCMVSDVA
jgi:hypothetical protein